MAKWIWEEKIILPDWVLFYFFFHTINDIWCYLNTTQDLFSSRRSSFSLWKNLFFLISFRHSFCSNNCTRRGQPWFIVSALHQQWMELVNNNNNCLAWRWRGFHWIIINTTWMWLKNDKMKIVLVQSRKFWSIFLF